MTTKKYLYFIILFVIFLSVPIMSMSYNSFKIKFEEGHSLNAGEEIEIPIILSEININLKQKGVIAFKSNIEFDENIFELVKQEDRYIIENEAIEDYINIRYNENNKTITFNISTNFFVKVADSLTQQVEIGKIKLRVKDDVETGDYSITFNNIIAENDEIKMAGTRYETMIHVVGDEEKEEEKEISKVTSTGGGSRMQINKNGKELILKIKQNEDGTIVTIIPDEINGEKIGKIIVDDKELERQNNEYILKTEYGKTYTLYAYDEDGNFLGNENIYAFGEKKIKIDNANDQKTEENKTNNNEKYEPGNDSGKKSNEKNISTENKTTENQTKENIISGIKTGDLFYIAIMIILLALFVLFIVHTIKNIKK